MSNINKVRLAHELLDEINARQDLTPEQTEVLRSFLPERPKEKTLKALRHDVYDVWAGVIDNEWPEDMYCSLENWLYELHVQLLRLAPDKPDHPEVLQTGAEYQEAPWGTIVAMENSATAWVKKNGWWLNTDGDGRTDGQTLWGVPRKVLRWGEGA